MAREHGASWPIVLTVLFGPALASATLSSALYAVFRPPSFDEFWNIYVWAIPILQLAFFAVVLLALRREGSNLAQLIAFRRTAIFKDIALALALFLAGFGLIVAYVLAWSMFQPGLAAPEISPASAIFTVVVGAATAGVCEETIWRGYSITRLSLLTGSQAKAAVISSLGFAVWHISPFAMPYTFLIGLMYSYAYIRLRRLLPLMLGHWLTNLIGFTISYLM